MAIKDIVKGICNITRCKYDVYTKERTDELLENPTILFESETGHSLLDDGEIEFPIALTKDTNNTAVFNRLIIYYSGGNKNCGLNSLVVSLSKTGANGSGQLMAMNSSKVYGIGRLSFGRISVYGGNIFEGYEPDYEPIVVKGKLSMDESEEYPNASLNFNADGTIDVYNKTCAIKIHKVVAYKY
jgi:hypothetical protein